MSPPEVQLEFATVRETLAGLLGALPRCPFCQGAATLVWHGLTSSRSSCDDEHCCRQAKRSLWRVACGHDDRYDDTLPPHFKPRVYRRRGAEHIRAAKVLLGEGL